MSSLFYALNIEDNHIKKINDYKKFNFYQKIKSRKDKEQIKYSYKESFKRENKSLLNDSELIKNYNDSLKSPQSRRLYKITESEFHTDII